MQVECGCCPTLYLECLAQNASADFCNSTICQVQKDCTGACSGTPVYYDKCGVLCGNNNCVPPPTNGSTIIPICLIVDLCGKCGGNGAECAGCDGVPNSGLEWGVNCATGQKVCNGTKPSACPPPVYAVATVSVVAGAVTGSLIALAGLSGFFILAAFLRRCHHQSALVASYDAATDELLCAMVANPLHQNANIEFQMVLDDADVELMEELGAVVG